MSNFEILLQFGNVRITGDGENVRIEENLPDSLGNDAWVTRERLDRKDYILLMQKILDGTIQVYGVSLDQEAALVAALNLGPLSWSKCLDRVRQLSALVYSAPMGIDKFADVLLWIQNSKQAASRIAELEQQIVQLKSDSVAGTSIEAVPFQLEKAQREADLAKALGGGTPSWAESLERAASLNSLATAIASLAVDTPLATFPEVLAWVQNLQKEVLAQDQKISDLLNHLGLCEDRVRYVCTKELNTVLGTSDLKWEAALDLVRVAVRISEESRKQAAQHSID